VGVRNDARSLKAKSLARRSRVISVLIGLVTLVASLAGGGSANTDCAPILLRYDVERGALLLRVCTLLPLPPAKIVMRYEVDLRLSFVRRSHAERE